MQAQWFCKFCHTTGSFQIPRTITTFRALSDSIIADHAKTEKPEIKAKTGALMISMDLNNLGEVRLSGDARSLGMRLCEAEEGVPMFMVFHVQ